MSRYDTMRTAFKRYLATSSAATAYNTAVFGATPTSGMVLTPTQVAATNGVLPIGKSLISQFIFFGAGADNATFNYRLWLAYRLQTRDGTSDPNILVQFAGDGTATLCGVTGTALGTAVAVTERFADTLTFVKSTTTTTPKGPVTDAETAFAEGTSGVFNPTSTTSEGIAQLFVPCAARAIGWIVDFDMTGATSGNCLIMADDV